MHKPSPIKENKDTPKRAYFDKNFFWRINVSELIADAGLILFSIFFSRYCFRDVDILHSLRPWQFMSIYAIVVLTLPWYLGYIYAFFEEYYGKVMMRIILITFIIIVLVVLIYMIRIMFSLHWMDDDAKPDQMENIMGMFSLFLLVLGPMMCIGGFVAGKDDSEPAKKASDNDASPTAALMIIVLAIAFLVWWSSYPAVQNHGWLEILIFFGSSFAAVIVFGIYLAIVTFLKKMGVYAYLSKFAATMFPVFIVCILVLWSDIDQHFIMEDFGNGGQMSLKYAILTLSIAGFIPFRLIMLFQPPLRFINMAIGIGAFLFYMYSIKP